MQWSVRPAFCNPFSGSLGVRSGFVVGGDDDVIAASAFGVSTAALKAED